MDRSIYDLNNIGKIRAALSGQGFDAIMVTDPASRLYAVGFESSDGVLLVTVSDAWFYTDSRYIEAAGIYVSGAHVRIVTKDETYADLIKAVLNENEITSVGFEQRSITYDGYLEWTKKLEAELVPAQELIDGLRSVKTTGDLEQMKKAQCLAEKSFEEILPLISTDITEKELAAELIYRFLRNGANDKSFNPIIVSGTKSSMPHGVPGDDKIGPGFLTIDFGVRLNGWCSDTTRTLCVGKPDDEMIRVYDTVLEAQEAGIKAARAGISGHDLDSAARVVIENAGYGGYFGHGFGHSLGLEVHESLKASPNSEDILPAGAVISAEPGIYLPGCYGVRIEDVLYIKENGCENITNLTKKLIVL
jgi:Xaa-Pro aminopeptidase